MIQKFFNKAAKTYDSVAFLQRAVCEELGNRLEFFQPEKISSRVRKRTLLDLGCGTGYGVKILMEKYPALNVIGLDLAFGMLTESRQKIDSDKGDLVCSNAHILPFQNNSVEFIFSNMSLQWCENLHLVFQESLRVLKTNGILLFSMPGPDTLKELRASWIDADPNHSHVNSFIDMHDVGDKLLQAGFSDPVLDVEFYGVLYDSVYDLLKDLKTLGSSKLEKKMYPGLTTRRNLAKVGASYERYRTPKGSLPVTYEIIFGVAKKGENKMHHGNEVFVPISKIKRRV